MLRRSHPFFLLSLGFLVLNITPTAQSRMAVEPQYTVTNPALQEHYTNAMLEALRQRIVRHMEAQGQRVDPGDFRFQAVLGDLPVELQTDFLLTLAGRTKRFPWEGNAWVTPETLPQSPITYSWRRYDDGSFRSRFGISIMGMRDGQVQIVDAMNWSRHYVPDEVIEAQQRTPPR